MLTLTVPTAATGLPPSILAFPSERTRPPAPRNGLLDRASWDRMFVAARVADQFRASDAGQIVTSVAQMIGDQGAASVARILEENAAALAALRGVVASLTEADRRLAAAADRYLQQESL